MQRNVLIRQFKNCFRLKLFNSRKIRQEFSQCVSLLQVVIQKYTQEPAYP